jgi:hypothetical protein
MVEYACIGCTGDGRSRNERMECVSPKPQPGDATTQLLPTNHEGS